MSSREVVRDIVQLQRTVSQINDEIPDAAITLTRTAAQAITTAGTVLVWQSRLRGQGITWSGSDITIPTDGWYAISLSGQTSVAINDLLISIQVGGVNVIQSAGFIGDIDRNRFHATFIRYIVKSNVVTIAVTPSANVNLLAQAEGLAGESPILNIVQLTNQAEV